MAGTSISFAGHNLQTTVFVTSDIDHGSIPTKNAAMVALSHANRSVIPFISYTSKNITISGTIIGSSIPDCDAQMDTFRSYFLNQDANLDIGYNGGTRRYIATATDVQLLRPGGLSYAQFTVPFELTQPFGMDTSTTTALNASARTLGSYSDAFTFTGTAPQQAPVFTYTLTAVTGGTAGTIIIGNNSTGQAISVTRTWSNGDVLVIDSGNPVPAVTVNGAVVTYSGAFPLFAPGSGTMTYSDNFTTRTFSESVVYTARYF